MKEVLYVLLDNYAEHEIGFMPEAVSTDATGFRKNPKYENKIVASTMEPVKSLGGMRTLPDYGKIFCKDGNERFMRDVRACIEMNKTMIFKEHKYETRDY